MTDAEMKQHEYLSRVAKIDELGDINIEIFNSHCAINSIRERYRDVFDEIALYEERIAKLKERAFAIFDIEQVKSYPDPTLHGTLTLVKGRRYIPIKDAEAVLEESVFNQLVKISKPWVKWTPPKEPDTK